MLREIVRAEPAGYGTDRDILFFFRLVDKYQKDLREKSLSQQAQALTSFMNSDEFRSLRQSNQEATHRIESAYQSYKSTRGTYSSEQREAEQYQEVARRAEVFSKTYSWNDVARFNEFLKERGHLGSIDRDTVTADFISGLLHRVPKDRLGAGPYGAQEIRLHPCNQI